MHPSNKRPLSNKSPHSNKRLKFWKRTLIWISYGAWRGRQWVGHLWPSSKGVVEFNLRIYFLIPLTRKMKIFWPPSKEIYTFELIQREFFNLPQKKCPIFSSSPPASLQTLLLPLTKKHLNVSCPHLSTTPHCWIEKDQPLRANTMNSKSK